MDTIKVDYELLVKSRKNRNPLFTMAANKFKEAKDFGEYKTFDDFKKVLKRGSDGDKPMMFLYKVGNEPRRLGFMFNMDTAAPASANVLVVNQVRQAAFEVSPADFDERVVYSAEYHICITQWCRCGDPKCDRERYTVDMYNDGAFRSLWSLMDGKKHNPNGDWKVLPDDTNEEYIQVS